MATTERAMATEPTAGYPAEPDRTIILFDTYIGAWEDIQPRAFIDPVVEERFRSVLARLSDHRGFRFRQDESVFRTIRRGYYKGRKGDLEFYAQAGGRMFSIEFFQNVANVENRNGGRYDFGKFARMPRTMQLACAVEMTHVLRKLLELGYSLDGNRLGIASADTLAVLRHAQGRTDEGDPLAKFDRSWSSHRFERDESGWPTLASVGGGRSRTDRDGRPIFSGETMCCRRGGRLFRGVVRPGPNDGWHVLSNGSDVHVTSRELFRCDDPSAEPRRFVPGQLKRVRAELEKALKANAYKRVEVLARVASRLRGRGMPRRRREAMTTHDKGLGAAS